jgi:hypothetical protein
MLVAALLARLAGLTGRTDFACAARAAVEYTASRQLPDGAWLYGEQPHLVWIDGFHTGYVLDCLLTCIDAGVGENSASTPRDTHSATPPSVVRAVRISPVSAGKHSVTITAPSKKGNYILVVRAKMSCGTQSVTQRLKVK